MWPRFDIPTSVFGHCAERQRGPLQKVLQQSCCHSTSHLPLDNNGEANSANVCCLNSGKLGVQVLDKVYFLDRCWFGFAQNRLPFSIQQGILSCKAKPLARKCRLGGQEFRWLEPCHSADSTNMRMR
jgi:hypothetical protein